MSETKPSVFITIQDQSIYFQEDWGKGIGGGLWSTGLALAHYFQTEHAAENIQSLAKARTNDNATRKKKQGLDVLELGSGNGLLAVCLMAAGKEYIQNLVVTDLDDHLDMIKKTIEANEAILSDTQSILKRENIHVFEHKWGIFADSEDSSLSLEDIGSKNTLLQKVSCGKHKFDFIVGSDVAYREELYDPLIASLLQFSHDTTVSLIGVTMADTQPAFFDLLHRAGFTYVKLSDHLLEAEFRGTTFGIFVVQKKKKKS